PEAIDCNLMRRLGVAHFRIITSPPVRAAGYPDHSRGFGPPRSRQQARAVGEHHVRQYEGSDPATDQPTDLRHVETSKPSPQGEGRGERNNGTSLSASHVVVIGVLSSVRVISSLHVGGRAGSRIVVALTGPFSAGGRVVTRSLRRGRAGIGVVSSSPFSN